MTDIIRRSAISVAAALGRHTVRVWHTMPFLVGMMFAVAATHEHDEKMQIGLVFAAGLAFALSEAGAEARAVEAERRAADDRMIAVLARILPPEDCDRVITIRHEDARTKIYPDDPTDPRGA